jgi:hypothetical protein
MKSMVRVSGCERLRFPNPSQMRVCIAIPGGSLEVRKRWSGFMIVDGVDEWLLPVSVDRASRIVRSKQLDGKCQQRLVSYLTNEEWGVRAELVG